MLSQSYFKLPKTTIQNNSIERTMLNQTKKVLEYRYRHKGGCDMYYDDNEHLYRKPRKDGFNYLQIDRSQKKDQGIYCIYFEG